MRNTIRAAIALVILVAAYWGWALIGAAELASAASQGDAEAVMQRVDLPALRRSLGGQIARAYLEQNRSFRSCCRSRRALWEASAAGRRTRCCARS